MDFTQENRDTLLKGLQDVRLAQTKMDNAQKDLNEKLGKLKTLAGVTGENSTKVIEATLMVMGREVEKVGWPEN